MSFDKAGKGKTKVYLSISKLADPIIVGKVKRYLETLDCCYYTYNSGTSYDESELQYMDKLLLIPPKKDITRPEDYRMHWEIGKGQMMEIHNFISQDKKDNIFVVTDVTNGLFIDEFVHTVSYPNPLNWQQYGSLTSKAMSIDITNYDGFRPVGDGYYNLPSIFSSKKETPKDPDPYSAPTVAIRCKIGTDEESKRIRKHLEALGGINRLQLTFTTERMYYYIRDSQTIHCDNFLPKGYTEESLPTHVNINVHHTATTYGTPTPTECRIYPALCRKFVK